MLPAFPDDEVSSMRRSRLMLTVTALLVVGVGPVQAVTASAAPPAASSSVQTGTDFYRAPSPLPKVRRVR